MYKELFVVLFTVTYPSLGDNSVTTVANVDLSASQFVQLPLYGHWFALEIYKQYLCVQEQVQSGANEIKIWDYKYTKDCLQTCSKGIKAAADCYNKRGRIHNTSGRGVWASERLRASELTYTGQIAHHLGTVIFPNPNDGMVVHQMPTRKTSGNPEIADGVACRLHRGVISEAYASWDTKLNDLPHAKRTTLCHSVNLVSVNHEYEKWPVLIGLPNTVAELAIEVHVPVDNAMWCVHVLQGPPDDLAIICTAAAAIRRLISLRIHTTTPIAQMMPTDKLMECLQPHCKVFNRRVFVDRQSDPATVEKYYSKEQIEILKLNAALIKEYGTLKNVEVEDVTRDGEVICLKYTYIEGCHSPTKVSQFMGVVKTLEKLHDINIVHGDVRRANIIFSPDGSSHLIDYDLTRKVNDLYPPRYEPRVKERHSHALEGWPMKPIHDRYALSLVIQMCELGNTIAVCTLLEDSEVDLEHVLHELQLLNTRGE